MAEVKKLDLNNLLGEGRYGKVFLGIWREVKVAVKRIEKSQNTPNDGNKEEEAMRKLDHPNVIRLFEVENDDVFRYYYLELCQSSLEKIFLKKGNPKKYLGPLPPPKNIFYQLAIGLEYIHEKGLIHRDLKPENVLIWVSPENGKVFMKWADFGLSKSVNERGTYSMSGVKGTMEWLAPELLKLLDSGENNQSEIEVRQRGTVKSDVFAEGLIFGYYLLDGFHPFGTLWQIHPNILTNKPVNLDKIQMEFARNLILKMLNENPENRITSSEVAQQLNPNTTKKEDNTPILQKLISGANNFVASLASRTTHIANGYDEEIYARVDTNRLKEEHDSLLSNRWGLVQTDFWPGIHQIYLDKIWEYFKEKPYKTIGRGRFEPFYTNASLSGNVFITIVSDTRLICLNYEVQVNRSVIVDKNGQIQNAKYEKGITGDSRIWTDEHGVNHTPALKRRRSSDSN